MQPAVSIFDYKAWPKGA